MCGKKLQVGMQTFFSTLLSICVHLSLACESFTEWVVFVLKFSHILYQSRMNFCFFGHFALTEFSVLFEEGCEEEVAAAYSVSFQLFLLSLRLVVMMYERIEWTTDHYLTWSHSERGIFHVDFHTGILHISLVILGCSSIESFPSKFCSLLTYYMVWWVLSPQTLAVGI